PELARPAPPPSTIPFGLGWADRLASASVSEKLSVRESFRRRLFVGITGIGVVSFSVATLLMLSIGFQLNAALMACGLFASLGCLVGFSVTARALGVFVNVWLGVVATIGLFSAIHKGGPGGFGSLIWGLAPAVIATLIVGRRVGAA